MPWFDAGVNLLDARFDAAEVIQNAKNADVQKLCVITTSPDEWDTAAKLYESYPESIVYTLGIHPHYAKDVSDVDLSRLETLVHKPGVVAIGECGLDFNRNFSPPEIQIKVFEAQLAIAKKQNKPVYLHERYAFEEQISSIKQVFDTANIRGLAHCFTGSAEQMNTYLNLGLYIGITGWLCDPKRGNDLRESIIHLPLDRLIFETDSPYLFPKNVRPRKRINEPSLLPNIAEVFAEITQQNISMLQQISYTNCNHVFEI
ncbi:TatD family hydrolase [Alteromonas sp. 5E99-2]|uniref:TatD family hydrolase n=1 Tax=Alteromonas sp. 5E99-2 TaxID=2817683 RepID=UPI001A99D610|nr:TatD family hydrolase [Alteromonas sp. 5E99-2]MBO1254596.1 TatD family hydrolase [Alteromonas sp. 5E99-2]